MDNRYNLQKIKWHLRRGTLELDTLCGAYFANHFEKASPAEKDLFLELLEMQDPELYDLLMHNAPYPSDEMKALVLKINPHVP